MSTRKPAAKNRVNTSSAGKPVNEASSEISETTEKRVSAKSTKVPSNKSSEGNGRGSQRGGDIFGKKSPMETEAGETKLVDIVRRGFTMDVLVDASEAARTAAEIIVGTDITIEEFIELVEHYVYAINNPGKLQNSKRSK